MGSPRAKATVVLRDPDGAVKVFEEGHALPKWALAEITNPDVVDLDELVDPDDGDDPGDGEDTGSGEAPADPDDAPPPVDEKPAPKPRTRARRAPAKTAK